ncbi:uncharacterized protein K444DRAFT_134739 [Hyaloscypha bicolor E]|uniref:CorA-like transporter domain-containing protein n=1 Tax=Hyaloscypha bicolor E TaxID=1095630 RepID=A0A2J6STE5_9HELO|nr:uncharacterized protein K444DRAFT_134739 [Hyaloscypha bicolor E]PMD54055.1 hypothetical protein K444DRAFT_134739 [Hyaloscypha bicolor E]
MTLLYAQPDACQIFSIYQKNSYSRLYITYDLFEWLLSAFSMFPAIWDFVLPFRFQTGESADVGSPPFKFGNIESVFPETPKGGSWELAYSFRYVVRNQREKQLESYPDYDPWSIRQTAVYQQYQRSNDKMIFVLIAPSDPARQSLEAAIGQAKDSGKELNAFELHGGLISTLQDNWRLYIRGLEQVLKDQSDRVTLAQVQSAEEPLSPLPDLVLNFLDRQRIKRVEDKILDLEVIFGSLLDTLSKLQRQSRRFCLCQGHKNCTCSLIIEELEEQMKEVQLNTKRAGILHKRVQGVAQILSDLLEYENAKSLSGLMQETRNEHGKVRILTEKSTHDAAAVKILTIITLIYLPITVVSGFFSTQLVHVDDNGTISIAKDAWWIAVVTVPLTAATLLAWQLWLYSSNKRDSKQKGGPIFEKAFSHNSLWSRVKMRERLRWFWGQFSGARNRQRRRTEV